MLISTYFEFGCPFGFSIGVSLMSLSQLLIFLSVVVQFVWREIAEISGKVLSADFESVARFWWRIENIKF
jgi:hypothetical protein